MPRAIITNEKIKGFLEIAPNLLMQLTQDANDKGTFFTATCVVKYRQEFDIDSDKGIGGEARVSPGVTVVGSSPIDGEAEAKAKISVEKSREGALWVEQHLEFASVKALLNRPAPQ